ncbi:MAG: hypothetical protein MUD12_07995 [Spirochaetes bacterium]|jgi:hypothetical protein|nr:hypothetical protein [Spirochaetota bacterium]
MFRESSINREIHVTHDLSRRNAVGKQEMMKFLSSDLMISSKIEMRYINTKGV